MIKINIALDYFEIKGHARFDEHGKDIVCSAISAITQTIALGLENYSITKRHMKSNGYLRIDIEWENEIVEALMKTMLMGLRDIEEQYPDYIQIKEDDIA